MSNSLWPHVLQHVRPPWPSLSLGVCSCPLVMPSHHLILCGPLLLSLSQHQGLFQWVSSLHQVAKVLELQPRHQSLQWIFRNDFLSYWLVWSPRDSQESSLAPQLENIGSSAVSIFYGPALTFVHDYWKNHSFDYMHLCWQSDVSAF